MQKNQSVFNRYFGSYSAPKTMGEKRFHLFNTKLDDIISEHLHASDNIHPNYLILDFILFADNYLSIPNPVSTNELKEIAAHFYEDYRDRTRSYRLEASSLDKVHFNFEPVTEMIPDCSFDDLKKSLNVKPASSHKMLQTVFEMRASDRRALADIHEVQASNFQNWLQSRQAKVFFESYRALQVYADQNNIAVRKAKIPVKGFVV